MTPVRPMRPLRPMAPRAPMAPGTPHGDMLREFNFDLPELAGLPARGRLGVRIESLSPPLGEYFGLHDGKGVLVLEVLKDTPAEKAGLMAGDVITRVGDQAVANSEDLVGGLRGKEGRVALRVVRHNAPRTIEATLEKPRPMRMQFFGDDQTPGDRRRIVIRSRNGDVQEITPEGGGQVRKRIVVRSGDKDDVRQQIEQLRRQLDELQQRLDEERGNRGD